MGVVLPLEERQENLRLSGGSEIFLSEPQVQLYNDAVRERAIRIRDSKLGTVEEVEKRINEYFDICRDTNQLPSVKALSVYMGVPFRVFKQYLNDPTSRYYSLLSSAQDLCHVIIENSAMNNKINPAVYMFTAANFYDMKNTQSVEIGRTSAERDLAASRESIEALKDLINREHEGKDSHRVKDAVISEDE